MNLITRIVVGAIAGWVTGKLVEREGRVKVINERYVLDTIFGMVGAVAGEYLLFWMVIGKGDPLSSYATAILGAIAMVGAARMLGVRRRSV